MFEKDCTLVTQSQRDTFRTQFNVWNGTTETFNFTTVVSDNEVAETCSGHVNTTTCIYTSGIAEYLVHVDTFDNTIKFPEPPSNPKIVARANNTALTSKSVKEHGLRYDHGTVDQREKSTLAGKCTRLPRASMLPYLLMYPVSLRCSVDCRHLLSMG